MYQVKMLLQGAAAYLPKYKNTGDIGYICDLQIVDIYQNIRPPKNRMI